MNIRAQKHFCQHSYFSAYSHLSAYSHPSHKTSKHYSLSNAACFQDHLPPDVGLGHDVLQSITELKEGLNLEHTRKQTGNMRSIWRQNKTCESLSLIWAAYPDNAVEAVDGREFELQAEEVKREDADYISLKRRKFTTTHNTSEVTVRESHHLLQQNYY